MKFLLLTLAVLLVSEASAVKIRKPDLEEQKEEVDATGDALNTLAADVKAGKITEKQATAAGT